MKAVDKVTTPKQGPFDNWTEDDESVEIRLPLPSGAGRKDLSVHITAMAIDAVLHVRGAPPVTLLSARPLAGTVHVEESTWYLESGILVIALAKQDYGGTRSDQYWGPALCAAGGEVACYLHPAALRAEIERLKPVDAASTCKAVDSSTGEEVEDAGREQLPTKVGPPEPRKEIPWHVVLPPLAVLVEIGRAHV